MMKAIAYSRQIRQAIEQRRNAEQEAARQRVQPQRSDTPAPSPSATPRSH